MTDVALGSATWVMLRWGDRIEDDGAHNIAGRFHNIASAPMSSQHDAVMWGRKSKDHILQLGRQLIILNYQLDDTHQCPKK